MKSERSTTIRWWASILLFALVAAACSGGSDDPSGNDGSLIGVVDGGEIEASPGEPPGDTVDPPNSTATPLECALDEICRIEVTLTRVALDATPSSISVDGDRAWLAAPDDLSMIEVDLGSASVVRTLALDAAAVDVVAGAGSLWVITYEFSFDPMLRVDASDGAVLATIGDFDASPRAVAIGDDAAWAIVDGYGAVARVDLSSNEITDTLGGSDISGGAGEVAIVTGGGVVWAIDESNGSVERIDTASRTIDGVTSDLGYSEEASGEFTSILSQGAKALAVTAEGIWVIADTPNPTDEVNVVGGAALFLLDAESGEVIERIDLAIQPSFGRPGLAITQDAAWYFGFVDRYPIRVDLTTGQQTFISLENDSAVGVATDGTTVWFAVENLFEGHSVVGVSAAEAASASDALDR